MEHEATAGSATSHAEPHQQQCAQGESNRQQHENISLLKQHSLGKWDGHTRDIKLLTFKGQDGLSKIKLFKLKIVGGKLKTDQIWNDNWCMYYFRYNQVSTKLNGAKYLTNVQ